jgi:hypothetical protein
MFETATARLIGWPRENVKDWFEFVAGAVGQDLWNEDPDLVQFLTEAKRVLLDYRFQPSQITTTLRY